MKSKKNIYYNYIYFDPSKPGKFFYPDLDLCFLFEPFYVGKGHNKRFLDHIKPHFIKYDPNKHKANKIKKLLKKYNLKDYCILINYTKNEKEAYKNEELLCKKIGCAFDNKGPLLNLSYGGLGGKNRRMPKEEKEKRSKNHWMKNKFYEELYGEERAKKIKEKRSKSLKNHPCYKNKARSSKLSIKAKNKVNIFDLINKEYKKVNKKDLIKNKFLIPYNKKNDIKVYLIKYKNTNYIFRARTYAYEKLNISETLFNKILKSNKPYQPNKHQMASLRNKNLIGLEIKIINNLEEIKKLIEINLSNTI